MQLVLVGLANFLLALGFTGFALVLSAAIYRYQMKYSSSLSICRLSRAMSRLIFAKMVLPLLVCLGLVALIPALYGFSLFLGFLFILYQSSLIFRALALE